MNKPGQIRVNKLGQILVVQADFFLCSDCSHFISREHMFFFCPPKLTTKLESCPQTEPIRQVLMQN